MNLIHVAIELVQATGVAVGVVFTGYMLVGFVGTVRYRPGRSTDRAENVRLVIPTVAAENVRPALYETIEHTIRKFSDYEVYVLLDEGSDLSRELAAMEGITSVVVPDDYDCEAIAKGRAMNYFIETIVANDPDYWYAFVDDDNRVLDDEFLYEIPHYERRGYRAMNPVLIPRLGRSTLTFVADHIRYVDDIAVYRLFTGVLGKPYLGFHGELLCVRGDVLAEIGFDRSTIVEDFAFALELVKRDIPVWQSRTRVSILSPHDLTAFLTQRSRWYVGVAAYLPKAPLPSQVIVGSRIVIWSVAVTSSWLLLPIWIFGFGLSIPVWLSAVLTVGTLIYVGVIGLGSWRVGGLKGALMVPLVPVYALMEHLVPLYALWQREREFVVIEK